MAQRPGGVVQIVMPWETIERHASTCAHCQHITEFESLRKMHEHVDVCRSCNRLVCLGCAGKPCTPFMKQVEAQEKRYQMLKDMGLA